jgi:UDP-N-acetylmuramoyl-L-alanyl-D-glutamate--2,6-diaminopimelate ligase
VAEGPVLEVLDRRPQGRFLALKRVEHLRVTSRLPKFICDGRIFEVTCRWPAISRSPMRWFRRAGDRHGHVERKQAMAALETIWKGRGPARTGRLDRAKGAPAYVDYAHKPEALEKVLLRCGRSPPAASSWCSVAAVTATAASVRSWAKSRASWPTVVIVTDDNPRSEDPAAIRAEIMAAAPGATEIGDRAKRSARRSPCSAGDTLIIAGKGHEPGQTVRRDGAALSPTTRKSGRQWRG